MLMQAEIVETLVEKAKFEPTVAVAIAEAIDMAIAGPQLVTVPVLDAHLERVKGEIVRDLVRWVLLVMMSQVAISTGIMYFLLQTVK